MKRSASAPGGGGGAKKKKWTASEKLRVVVEAGRLSDQELGAYLRSEGLHEAQVRQWREAAESAVGGQSRETAEKNAASKQVRILERELRRKEKALAEAAALLVLKKKAQEIWGDEDDSTAERSDW